MKNTNGYGYNGFNKNNNTDNANNITNNPVFLLNSNPRFNSLYPFEQNFQRIIIVLNLTGNIASFF
jgi:hypothetical protein